MLRVTPALSRGPLPLSKRFAGANCGKHRAPRATAPLCSSAIGSRIAPLRGLSGMTWSDWSQGDARFQARCAHHPLTSSSGLTGGSVGNGNGGQESWQGGTCDIRRANARRPESRAFLRSSRRMTRKSHRQQNPTAPARFPQPGRPWRFRRHPWSPHAELPGTSPAGQRFPNRLPVRQQPVPGSPSKRFLPGRSSAD